MGVLLNDAAVNDTAASSWIRTPYGVCLSEDPVNSFTTFLEIEKFVMAQDGSTDETSATVSEWMDILDDDNLGSSEMNRDGLADGNVFYSKPNYTDTRVGGNDAINPYWQFNRDDDIVPPLLAMSMIRGSNSDGMGRVYSEVYDSTQQLLWMSMGVTEYVNLVTFYKDSGNVNASRAMNKGTLRGIVGTVIKLVFSATVWAITFPITAPFWVHRWLTRVDTERVSKYCYFKPSMVIYYEMVNTMISYLAVSMGLYPQIITRRKDSSKVLDAEYAQMQGVTDSTSAADATSDFQSYTTVGQTYADNITNIGTSEYTEGGTTAATEQAAATVEDATVESLSDAYDISDSSSSGTSNATSDSLNSDTYTGYVSATDTTGETQQLADDNALALQAGDIADSGIPELLHNGPDIFTILNRRNLLFNANRYQITTRMLLNEMRNEDQNTGTDHWTSPNVKYKVDADGNVVTMADEPDAATKGAWTNTWDSLKANAFCAGDYIGFRIERGVSTSESISNSTGATGIAQKLNDYASAQKDKYASTGNSWMAKTLADFQNGPMSVLKQAGLEIAGKLASGTGLGDMGAVLTTGNGFLDIPEVWKGSTFSRSYNFSIQLRARYGDPVSIYQSIYIPLCMLLAAGMPRSVGNNMYTSPFMIRAYCKGMFAIPFGIIDNLSITRGKDEFGWSNVMLPTAVDVSLSIKDLTPTFFLAMQDIGLFDTFSTNDNFIEYLDTLSALGITERICYWPKVMRKLSAALLIKRNTIFNSSYWGMRMGRTAVARAIGAITPFANYEKTDFESNLPGTTFK